MPDPAGRTRRGPVLAALAGATETSLVAFWRHEGRVRLDDVTGVLGGATTLEGALADRVAEGLASALSLAFAVTAGVALLTRIVAFSMPALDPAETG